MRNKQLLRKILTKLLKRLGIIKEFEVDMAEMCRKSVATGVCPNCCKMCAWNSTR